MALGLYVHVPFCSAICNYCNFNRGLFDADLKARYVTALQREIEKKADGSAADTVYFGGGTPSLLEPAEVAAVVSACRSAFDLAGDAEVTLEANPETVTEERLAGFLDAGVNRLSFGVQSFHDDELRKLGRLHTASRAVEAVAMARRAGFDNVSVDLMMWLPEQSIDRWLESVDRLVDLAPEHASLYILELYPNAPLRETMARSRWSLAPDDDAADMYLAAMNRLDRAEYLQYEISNVAKPGRQSRHNLKYWTDGQWLGFGCGAHSTRNAVRWKNISATGDYTDAVFRDLALEQERRELNAGTHLEEILFTGLRLTDGVDLESLRRRYGVDVWARHGGELTPFLVAGLLHYDGTRLRLSRAGMLVASEILTVFLRSPVVD